MRLVRLSARYLAAVAGAVALLSPCGSALAQPSPESPDALQVNTATWGGFGEIAGNHETNLCQDAHIEPGGQRAAMITRSEDGRVLIGTVMCAPALEIWGNTAGPWDPNAPGGPGWLSIRCPQGDHPVDSSAGFAASPHRHLTQVGGSFGSGRDGFWNYRFHNWSAQTVRIQFWGFCWRTYA